MQCSAKTEYAAVAMLALAARFESGQLVRVRDIAEEHGIPSRFLVQILLQLKTAGLVVSTRGASGGYQLAVPPDEVTLADVSAAVEGAADTRESKSGDTAICRVLQAAWQRAADAQLAALEGVTLADLVEQSSEQPSEMYYI